MKRKIMARVYRCVSADSHLEISPNRWRDRVPEQYRERAPRAIRLPNGGDAIIAENKPLLPLFQHNSGVPWEEWGHDRPRRWENSAGAGTPQQRLADIDLDGVDAEILFPGVSGWGMWSGIADHDAYCAVASAYNEFIAEEYMAAAPDRFIPVGVMPDRGVARAIAELEHCKRLGLKAIALDAFPNGSLTPKPEDDEFWSAALDLDMPLTVHTQFSRMRDGRGGGGLDLARRISTYGVKAAPIAMQLAIHGVFERLPKLQLYFAENEVGWIPNFLEQADILWERQRFYHERMQGLKPLDRKPSEYVKAHCSWGFMDNRVGVELRHHIGVDHMMWSTDFPHDPSDWPHSQDVITRNFAGVPEDEKQAIVAGNAVRYFHLDEDGALPEKNSGRVAEPLRT